MNMACQSKETEWLPDVVGRQLQMQNAMREWQMPMQLTGARKLFNWLASFHGIATLAMLPGYVCNSFVGVSLLHVISIVVAGLSICGSHHLYHWPP